MIRSNLTLFCRKLNKRKGSGAINISGLSVSLAGALLIYLYVVNEFSYDRFNENLDRTL